MAEKDLQKWTTFFHEAGVPRGPANEYATLFCDHRIKDTLLGDLTKEILNDIGITVMGDIMSILKHAKAVYAKLEREKSSNQLIQQSESVDQSLIKKQPVLETSSQIKKKKVVGKLSGKPDIQQSKVLNTTLKTKVSQSEPKVTITVDDSSVLPKKKAIKTSMTLSERFASEVASKSNISTIQKKSDVNNQTETSPTKKPCLTTTKPIRLIPGDKGGVNAAAAPVKRKSAFERLGKEESNNLSKDMESLSPKIKITKLTKVPVKPTSSKIISLTKNESSVFKRLGENDSSSIASTSRSGALTIRTIKGSRVVSDDNTSKNRSNVASALRPLKPIRAVQPVKPVSTVKARVSVDTTKESSRKSVFSRLGNQT